MSSFRLIHPTILSIKKIPFVNQMIAKEYGLPSSHDSMALITTNSEHALFVSLDKATKESDADVIFKTSLYGGFRYHSGPLSGEALGVFSGENPTIIDNALKATKDYLNEKAFFYTDNDMFVFFPHVIGSIGRLLAKETGLEEGSSLAYLFAPPIETTIAIDYALKNSATTLVKFFKPPTNTNFSGAYLTGTLAECLSAKDAFISAIEEIHLNPIDPIY